MGYERIFQFKGTWRNYQARVLQNATKYLQDGKVHIVAAPGSGKTTLGIELMNRMGKPALVFAPTITIREQWVARISEAFLKEGLNAEDYLSQDLKDLRLITISTYQSLHSAMNHYKGKEEDKTEDTDDKAPALAQEVDYSDYDLVAEVKRNHIGVLCLDECHHLRSEWWKALENFKNECGNLQVIALTATPPYDSNKTMWDRYMSMCGEIDEEITIPELVKEGSLCAHQDFVYFNYPTKDELDEVNKFNERVVETINKLLNDPEFRAIIASHPSMQGITTKDDELLEDPAYLSSILIFAATCGMNPPYRLVRLLGVDKLPPLAPKWMEKLLQGVLYTDTKNYNITEEQVDRYKASLKVKGLLEKNKVVMVATDNINKLLTRSKGKCESIKKIVAHEYAAMGENLRLLVLADYIKKEYEKCIGDLNSDVTALGVLPFFEMLRREQDGSDMPQTLQNQRKQLRLGVLCGTIVIIPYEAKAALEKEVEGIGKVTFSAIGQLGDTDYVKVNAVGDAHFLTGAVTNLFTNGYMQVLIGTKSLLGEGWDSPCINSLILASFVGSFMLSNQMRGRAIRVFKQNPNKCSNIWHLVCLNPWNNTQSNYAKGEEISEDFALLERRMDNFLGLHYEEDVIESSIQRLSYIRPPFDERNVAVMNGQMLQLSSRRDILKQRWQQALVLNKQMEIAEEAEVKPEAMTTVVFQDAIKNMIISGVITVGGLALTLLQVLGTPGMVIFGGITLVGAVKALTTFPKLLSQSSPLKRLRIFGKGVVRALQQKQLLEDNNVAVRVDELANGSQSVYISGGTPRDKQLFAQCISQMMGAVDNQRYLLVNRKNRNALDGFYCVPECFAGNKNDAQLFADCIKFVVDRYDLVYTRNEQGRKLLLEGRSKALANKQIRATSRKKVKSALE